ncbi:MAG TPA: aminoglycoside phosphotransferase family protein [Chryseosolibacter sp.]
MELDEVLTAYDMPARNSSSQLLSSGLINSTWKISCGDKAFIVQRINTGVFQHPEWIAENLELLGGYLSKFPGYLFVGPIKNANGKTLTTARDGSVFRIFPFIKNSYTIDKVSSPEEAFEAARQFGKFTSVLTDFNANRLKITLPDFHNLSLRYRQFIAAVENGNRERILKSRTQIASLKKEVAIVEEFERIRQNANFKIRVTHHDTKISNVLFDGKGKGLCVIDLDTVMPGYFISDVGDMMRTYLSPTTEEETDFSKISIRNDVYRAIVEGYLSEMNQVLTPEEKQKFMYAGKFMIYMQALRFLTDYLNNDVYYGARYPDHNLNRAGNQITLLSRINEVQDGN